MDASEIGEISQKCAALKERCELFEKREIDLLQENVRLLNRPAWTFQNEQCKYRQQIATLKERIDELASVS